MKNRQFFLLSTLCLLIFASCQSDDEGDFLDDIDITDINDIGDNNNPPSTNDISIVELGRLLFWDPILSGEKDVACASCHHPDFGYADGRALPIGVGGLGLGPDRVDATTDGRGFVGRNSPTIINTAFNGMDDDGGFDPEDAPMFWDNRTRSLEAQALGPLESFEEMRGHAFAADVALDSIVNRLRMNTQYSNLFENAFGNNNSINAQNIAVAIAAFERTITATDSPFDRFQAGDQNAMNQAQIRGMNRFNQIGCDDCHSGPMFSDFQLHVLGVPDNNQLNESDSGANGTYAFRTPTLRNLGMTAPFFHSGVAGNLEETVEFYRTARNFARNNGGGGGNGGGGNGGGNGGLNVNPNVDPQDIDNDIRNLGNLNNNDIEDIAAFIEALNDPNFDREIPQSVPSGLNPGGNID